MSDNNYQVIVIGGGHAGVEAALACSRMGIKTLLITHNIETIGQMSCNPAIGGIGKGHLVKEIDALGGVMAEAIDDAGIQFRVLNSSKGPAVRATRAQADRVLYKQAIRYKVENQKNLTLFQQAVDDLIIESQTIKGVITQLGLKFYAQKVILTTGTFLKGIIHIGRKNYPGGRLADPPANTLAEKLYSYDFKVDRLKTGTPPRLDGRTINYDVLKVQNGDIPVPVFSFNKKETDHPKQIACYITYTNEKTHEIIQSGLKDSPLYGGVIEGVGPRYCPSVEDKIVKFAHRNSHQIFIEPEGLMTNEVYPNGISTSLSYDIQEKFVKSIKGFEKAKIVRPGYAIEYDFFDPKDLYFSLETKKVKSLFFAGQINGTTGYEEAAAQGLVAGINAALQIKEKDELYLKRDESYIGVMIDDLITKGVEEPYRMFTSRAEYRLLLREDNADYRLMPKAYELGLISNEVWTKFQNKYEKIASEKQRLKSIWVQKGDKNAEKLLATKVTREYNLESLLKRPNISYLSLVCIKKAHPLLDDKVVYEQVENQIKYEGYIKRQQDEIDKYRKNENTLLPGDIDYSNIKALSLEVRHKLTKYKPKTIGQASRIEGITPAAISILLVYLKS